jgi:hypothetical protein
MSVYRANVSLKSTNVSAQSTNVTKHASKAINIRPQGPDEAQSGRIGDNCVTANMVGEKL